MGGVVFESALKALNMRYTLLPYLYTLFYENTIAGDPVLRSLKLNFPEDQDTNNNDRQFMWGDALLINAIVEEGATQMKAYLPQGIWYDWQSQKAFQSAGQVIDLIIELGDVKPMLRGGRIIPSTPSQGHGHNSTQTQRVLPFRLNAALDSNGEAYGQLFWDDGDSLTTLLFDEYTLIEFDLRDSNLTSTPVKANFLGTIQMLDIQVWGLEKEPTEVTFFDKDEQKRTLEKGKEFKYNSENKVLSISPFTQEGGQELYDLAPALHCVMDVRNAHH